MNVKNPPQVKELLKASLDSGWGEFNKQFSLCHESFTEDAVHYLRVSLRRLLTLCDLIHAVIPSKAVMSLKIEFQKMRDLFDNLRDTQVMILRLGEIVNQFPEVRFFIDYLTSREQKASNLARKQLAGVLPEELAKLVNKIHLKLDAVSNEPQDFESGVLGCIDASFKSMMKKRKKVDPENSATIHPLRIAFRNFRYLLEMIYPLLSGFPLSYPGELKRFQDAMGDVQNDEVLLSALEKYSKRKNHINQDRVVEYINEHHSHSVQALIENISCLEKFWRLTGESNFPWVIERDGLPLTPT